MCIYIYTYVYVYIYIYIYIHVMKITTFICYIYAHRVGDLSLARALRPIQHTRSPGRRRQSATRIRREPHGHSITFVLRTRTIILYYTMLYQIKLYHIILVFMHNIFAVGAGIGCERPPSAPLILFIMTLFYVYLSYFVIFVFRYFLCCFFLFLCYFSWPPSAPP